MEDQSYGMESTAEKELDEIIHISQMESKFDIDKTLNDTAKKNKLTKMNVKNLIKNVITNSDVATMLRQTLDNNVEANCLYEPKLTRAKIKEMLKTNPSSEYKDTSVTSECQLLIENEFLDDSDDEEYTPHKEEDYDKDEDDDDDDDNETKCTSINSSFEVEVNDENCISISENETMINSNDKETICMRTRSKLSLNDTPLEIIEQAFIPPDFTEDMYDPVCHNDEWIQFLSEFTKPLEFVQNDDQNDVEDDPEYNVLCDDELSNVDKEEFRIDKSVRITRKEYTSLINELSEFTDSFIHFNGLETESSTDTKPSTEKNVVKSKNLNVSISDNTKPLDSKLVAASSDELNESILNPNNSKTVNDTFYTLHFSNLNAPINFVNKQDIVKSKKCITYIPDTTYFNSEINDHEQIINRENSNKNSVSQFNEDCNNVYGMSPKQIILFKQQLTQHVQLLTQNYILCTMTANLKKNCPKLINLLKKINEFGKDKLFVPINIATSLSFIQDWNEIYTYENNIKDRLLPLDVKEFMFYYTKPVFIYPGLLPSKSYTQELNSNYPFGFEEEKLLVLKIDYVYKSLKESRATKSKYKSKNIFDLLPIIIETVHRRWFKHRRLQTLKQFLTLRNSAMKISIMKNYLTHGKIEEVNHIVDVNVLFNGNCLYSYDIEKFPSSWKLFISQLMLKR